MGVMAYLQKRKKFNRIAKGIKTIKIQGARNIAKQALIAYNLFPTKKSKQKLIFLRSTEPMLVNVLNKMDGTPYEELITHFDEAQEKINKFAQRLIKNKDVIYTHCHSTNVTNALIYSINKKKKFEVYNTETRPLFQGRVTSKELSEAGIKVTQFVDSAMNLALTKNKKSKKVNKIFIGADALLKEGIINKVGSGMLAQLAHNNKIPLYIIADSWKYSSNYVKIEERDFHEVWKNLSKKSKIKINNPAFELIPRKYIKGIVSELGLLSYGDFLKKVKKE